LRHAIVAQHSLGATLARRRRSVSLLPCSLAGLLAVVATALAHDRGEAVPAWRDVMEHLVTAADAGRAAAEAPPSDESFASEPTSGPGPGRLRSSYVASLLGPPPADPVP
jgi:uncharacterized protein (DUF3084 family)